MIEDSEDDAWYIERAFKKQGYNPELTRVETEQALLEVVHSEVFDFDIVLSDYNLPGFNGMDAISIVKQKHEFVPVILVSGRVGEEQAADLIRAGADDYVVKGNLERLFPAIERELQRAETKRARERAEKQLEESEERFALIFHFSPDPIVITNGPEQILDTVNHAFLEFTNKSVREIFNSGMREVVDWNEDSRFDEVAEKLDKDDELEPFELTYTDPHGKSNTIIWSVSTIPYEHKRSQLWIGKDITEIKTMYKQIRESERLNALGTLAGGIAHDFNNILMVMLGYNEMSMEKLDKSSKVGLYQEEINAAIMRASDLVQQILAFSRKSEGEPQIIQVGPILKEVVKLLTPTLPATIRIEADIRSECFIQADPTHIHQIAMNLCTNSYHAMRKTGGTLSISAYDHDEHMELTVIDTGVGMEPEVLEHACDPFFTTKEVGEGTGLGLSVVHGILSSYNGDLSINSVPDEGTKVKCRIPAVSAGGESKPAETLELQPHQIQNRQLIAVVDDEHKIADVMGDMLEEIGYQVDVYYSAKQVENAVIGNGTHYDCIVSDITMPVITGVDLAERIHSVFPDIPFVLCSGSDIGMHVSDPLYEELTYITKPVRRDTLLRIVGDTIEKNKRRKDYEGKDSSNR
ncbi:MAG: response regulator [Spirochaetota bacterium]